MKYLLYLLPVFLCISNKLFAQKPELVLSYACRPALSPFAKVKVFDRRSAIDMAYAQRPLGQMALDIKYEGSLTDSIALFFTPADSEYKTNGELRIFLNELLITGTDYMGSSSGSVHIAMRFFYNAGDGQFVELKGVDTVYHATARYVNKTLLRSVSEHLCEIASELANLEEISGAKRYSTEEMNQLDSLEKSKLPIYYEEKINKGIFRTFDDFKMNKPVKENVFMNPPEDGTVVAYVVTPKGGKWINRKKGVYVISDGVLLAINIHDKFYHLTKEGSDYYFYIKEIDFTNTAVAWFLFGVPGAMVALAIDMDNIYNCKYKIDPHTGNAMLESVVKIKTKYGKKVEIKAK